MFNSILASTIWREPNHVRIVWITLLAMADKHGVAEGSVPGLADFARVSVADCRDALERLAAPDEDSRSKEYDGRRIQPIEGGWLILNHGKYRQRLNEDERREYLRIKKAESRLKSKAVNTESTAVNICPDSSTASTQAEAEAEADGRSREQKAEAVTAAAATAKPRYAPGALAGSLPRDHVNCGFCGARFCVSAAMLARMARAYGDGGEAAALAWVESFHAGLTSGYGGPVWLLQHWDAHLAEIGRVKPAPKPQAKPKSFRGISDALAAPNAPRGWK